MPIDVIARWKIGRPVSSSATNIVQLCSVVRKYSGVLCVVLYVPDVLACNLKTLVVLFVVCLSATFMFIGT